MSNHSSTLDRAKSMRRTYLSHRRLGLPALQTLSPSSERILVKLNVLLCSGSLAKPEEKFSTR